MHNPRAGTETKPAILLADTSPHILNLLADTFQLNNFSAYPATSTQECLAIYAGHKDSIDMVLMYGAIAANGGVELIIAIRRLKPHQKIMAFVEEERLESMAMRVGPDIVVLIPIFLNMVLHQMNTMLSQTVPFLNMKKAKFQRHQE